MQYLLLVLLILTPSYVFGHGGRVDSFGCHVNKTINKYECHSGQFEGRTFVDKAAMLVELDRIAKIDGFKFELNTLLVKFSDLSTKIDTCNQTNLDIVTTDLNTYKTSLTEIQNRITLSKIVDTSLTIVRTTADNFLKEVTAKVLACTDTILNSRKEIGRWNVPSQTINHSDSFNIKKYTLHAKVTPKELMTGWKAIFVHNYVLFMYASSKGYCGDSGILVGHIDTSDKVLRVCFDKSLVQDVRSTITTTYDGVVSKLFVNGNLVKSTPWTTDPASSTGTIQLNNSKYGELFNGEVDVRLFNYPKTDQEVMDLYNEDPTPQNFGLLSWTPNSPDDNVTNYKVYYSTSQPIGTTEFKPVYVQAPLTSYALLNFTKK
jgi:hypothetical protein